MMTKEKDLTLPNGITEERSFDKSLKNESEFALVQSWRGLSLAFRECYWTQGMR